MAGGNPYSDGEEQMKVGGQGGICFHRVEFVARRKQSSISLGRVYNILSNDLDWPKVIRFGLQFRVLPSSRRNANAKTNINQGRNSNAHMHVHYSRRRISRQN